MEIKIKEAIVEEIGDEKIYRVKYMINSGINGTILEHAFVLFGKGTLTADEIKKKIEDWEGVAEEKEINNDLQIRYEKLVGYLSNILPPEIWLNEQFQHESFTNEKGKRKTDFIHAMEERENIIYINGEYQSNDAVRPPLGVTPRFIWIEKRIDDLARAIHEYAEFGRYEPIPKWTKELNELLVERDPKHYSVNEARKELGLEPLED